MVVMVCVARNDDRSLTKVSINFIRSHQISNFINFKIYVCMFVFNIKNCSFILLDLPFFDFPD